jgi:hypothetical protein
MWRSGALKPSWWPYKLAFVALVALPLLPALAVSAADHCYSDRQICLAGDRVSEFVAAALQASSRRGYINIAVAVGWLVVSGASRCFSRRPRRAPPRPHRDRLRAIGRAQTDGRRGVAVEIARDRSEAGGAGEIAFSGDAQAERLIAYLPSVRAADLLVSVIVLTTAPRRLLLN